MNEQQQQQQQQITRTCQLSDAPINAIAGATSGLLVSILVSPLDVIRTRIQVERLPKGVPDMSLFTAMYRLNQREGLRAFYKGLGATMLVSHNRSNTFTCHLLVAFEISGVCT
jgi:hypothetical protein